MLPYYTEVFERMAVDPQRAQAIVQLDEHADIYPLILGIAYAERFGHTVEQQRRVADLIKEWHVLNGYTYLYEWPEPISTMTGDQIIVGIRAERDAGMIPPPTADRSGQRDDDLNGDNHG